MTGLSPEGVRGPENFFFTPYSGKQFDAPKPVPKPARYPVILANRKTFRTPNQNSIYDVRATYPADHVLFREQSSPPEVSSAPSSTPTLSDLFLRAQIPKEDEALRKIQEQEWMQRVWNVPTTVKSVKAVVEKRGGINDDEEHEKACDHPCTVCTTETPRHSRNTMRDIFDKYSTFFAVCACMGLVQFANAQALDADDDAMTLFAFLFGDTDLFISLALPGFPSISFDFLSSPASLAATALSPLTLTHILRCHLFPLLIFSLLLNILLIRVRERTRAYEELCLFCCALILCFGTLGTNITTFLGLAVLVKQIISGTWSIESRVGNFLAYAIETVLEAVCIVASILGDWVTVVFSGVVDIAQQLWNAVQLPISRFVRLLLKPVQIMAISIYDLLGRIELVVSRKKFWINVAAVVLLSNLLVQNYLNGQEGKLLVRRLTGDAGLVRTVTVY